MPEPDFSEFDDWLEGKNSDNWPQPLGILVLSDHQRSIVARNAAYLLDRAAWNRKAEKFESTLSSIGDRDRQFELRKRYCIHFDGHVFSASATGLDLSSYQFPCAVSFSNAIFEAGSIRFDNADFGTGDIRFDNAAFGDGNIWFNGTRFGDGDVRFDNVLFSKGDVWFENAEFGNGSIQFTGSRFGVGDVWFMPTSVEFSELSFEDSVIEGNLFVKARFGRPVSFALAHVAGTADFSDCEFSVIPDFRDAKFDRPPEVSRLIVDLPKMSRVGLFRIAQDSDDVAKFRKLKAMAIAANDHERDGYFFAREMMAKRGIETKGFLPLFLDSAYALLSGYGQSISRPIWSFVASFVAFATVYALPLQGKTKFGQAVLFATEYSARNAVPFANSLFRFALTPSGYTTGFEKRLDAIHRQLFIQGQAGLFDWIIAASVFQQLFGGVLLFLLLLGLRNKFRLK